jgi:hypothetical protein
MVALGPDVLPPPYFSPILLVHRALAILLHCPAIRLLTALLIIMALFSYQLRVFALSLGLLPGLVPAALAQPAGAAMPPMPEASPKWLLKSGLRLTHLFYLPGSRNWQLVLPSSLGLEYRLKPRLSLYAQAEADVSAGRGPRGRRGRAMLPTASTSLGVGTRYYFNQPAATSPARQPERWGNYLALEFNAEITQAAQRGRRGRGQNAGLATPAVFAFYGAQHSGPGRRLLYDVNAGLGIEAPAYASEPRTFRPWDMAAQVNLRVYVVNHRRAAKSLLLR